MRRSALVFVLAAAIFATACSTDESNPSPTGPSAAPSPTLEPALALGCRQHGLISVQLAGILPAGPPLRLLGKGIAKLVLMEFALVTRKPALAKARALDLIDFITKNRNNLINPNSAATLTKLVNVTDAILCEVGLPLTGVTDPVHTGIGVVPANNPTVVIITTPQGDAGLLVPVGISPATVVVTVTSHLTTPLGTPLPLDTPLDQYGQTIDLTASQDVLWRGGGVTVALCVAADEAILPRLRVGHEGGLPENKFGAIEILPVAEETPANVAAILGNSCLTSSGSRAGFQRWKEFAQRVFLPDPLYALATAATIVIGKGGQAVKFSKFRAVDPQLDLIANPASTDGVAGAQVATPPSVTVETKTLHTAVSGIPVKFKVADGSPGTIDPADPATVTTNSDGVASATSWTLGPGQNTVTATAVPPIAPITFTPTFVTFTATANTFFGFENGEPVWNAQPFWNRNTLTGLTNSAFPLHVTTFPGGALPAPFTGSWAMWYGEPSTGNYIGTQAPGDAAGSGGTSASAEGNSGSVLSPAFIVPASGAVQLRFRTWWEIESVNPATYDLMSVEIQGGEGVITLRRLNPAADPVGSSAEKPFTSGGFNVAPAWQDEGFDLSGFQGQTVQLRLTFNTGDGAYNGFRGWIVDDVRVVTGEPLLLQRLTAPTTSEGPLVPADRATFPQR